MFTKNELQFPCIQTKNVFKYICKTKNTGLLFVFKIFFDLFTYKI